MAIYFYLIAATCFFLDQLTKFLVRIYIVPGRPLNIIPGVLNLTYIKNVGAAFGILYGQTYFLLAVGVAVMAAVLYYHFRVPRDQKLIHVSLALIFGGSLSNFLDRLLNGYVMDMIDIRFWPVFNIADTVIVIGVAILLYEILTEKK
ncbi:MAG: signal peptidase II [Candidatus Saganbacteria bacterium]|nr:signal peptidase II [Candidatus Saganbacteria bacterium]